MRSPRASGQPALGAGRVSTTEKGLRLACETERVRCARQLEQGQFIEQTQELSEVERGAALEQSARLGEDIRIVVGSSEAGECLDHGVPARACPRAAGGLAEYLPERGACGSAVVFVECAA